LPSLTGRHLSKFSTYCTGHMKKNPPLVVWDEILWSSGPETLSTEGRENWGKWEGKE